MSLVLMPLAGETFVQRADRKVNSLEPKGENDRWNKRMQFASSRSVIIPGPPQHPRETPANTALVRPMYISGRGGWGIVVGLLGFSGIVGQIG